MISEDRELLAELARLNCNMLSFALRIMDGSADITEQWRYAQRLMAAAQRLQRRADGTSELIIEGKLVFDDMIALPAHTVEPDWEP